MVVLRVCARLLLGTGVVLGAVGVWLFSGDIYRGLLTLTFLPLLAATVDYAAGRGPRWLLKSGIAFGLLACSPLEICALPVGGGVRIVPLIHGYPSLEMRERARSGVPVHGGG